MIEKLALGTVQFGIDYGINNSTGQVKKMDVQEILKLCRLSNIDVLDTAFAYGSSEKVLGENDLSKFKIVSKFPPYELNESLDFFQKSLDKLKQKELYAYMLHNFSIYKKDKNIWNKLMSLKESGRVEKIGISLYSPEELEILFEDNIDLDIIQIPYNIFDRRFEDYLLGIKNRGIEIHTRSSFLQGLFFKRKQDLPQYFKSVENKIELLNSISQKYGISIVELCLGYVLRNDLIDKIVIGVDSTDQLDNNIKAVLKLSNRDFDWTLLAPLKVDNISILNPSLWTI